jgi:hypothetical protein
MSLSGRALAGSPWASLCCLLCVVVPAAASSSIVRSFDDLRGRPYNVSYDNRSMLMDGRRVLLLGGSFHYPRAPPEEWRGIMQTMKDDGLNHLQMYTFWNLHEQRRGVHVRLQRRLVGEHHVAAGYHRRSRAIRKRAHRTVHVRRVELRWAAGLAVGPAQRGLPRQQRHVEARDMVSTIKVGMGRAKSTYLRNHAFKSPVTRTDTRS